MSVHHPGGEQLRLTRAACRRFRPDSGRGRFAVSALPITPATRRLDPVSVAILACPGAPPRSVPVEALGLGRQVSSISSASSRSSSRSASSTTSSMRITSTPWGRSSRRRESRDPRPELRRVVCAHQWYPTRPRSSSRSRSCRAPAHGRRNLGSPRPPIRLISMLAERSIGRNSSGAATPMPRCSPRREWLVAERVACRGDRSRRSRRCALCRAPALQPPASSSLRTAAIGSKPSSRRCRTVASPMPVEAPVTSTVPVAMGRNLSADAGRVRTGPSPVRPLASPRWTWTTPSGPAARTRRTDPSPFRVRRSRSCSSSPAGRPITISPTRGASACSARSRSRGQGPAGRMLPQARPCADAVVARDRGGDPARTRRTTRSVGARTSFFSHPRARAGGYWRTRRSEAPVGCSAAVVPEGGARSPASRSAAPEKDLRAASARRVHVPARSREPTPSLTRRDTSTSSWWAAAIPAGS